MALKKQAEYEKKLCSSYMSPVIPWTLPDLKSQTGPTSSCYHKTNVN